MSMLARLTAMGGAAPQTYVDDVFSAYTYTGTGATQTITNGIDLASKGGAVWIKSRSAVVSNAVYDSVRGSNRLITDSTASAAADGINGISLLSSGFTLLGSNSQTNAAAAASLVSWTFRKAPKFFDVVTYTGNGLDSRLISHSLGIAPGMIIVKRTDAVGAWGVYHKDLGVYSADVTKNVYLNTTAAADNSGLFRTGGMSNTTFSVRTDAVVNATGGTYVAYLFAHDPSADGIVQCGSYTGNGSTTGPVVSLGWEPQYLLIKKASSGVNSNWIVLDAMRGMSVGAATPWLKPNDTSAEQIPGGVLIAPNATGFQAVTTNIEINENTQTFIYLAIRRPNKPPTLGTQVYNAIARTGTGAAATVTGVGFAPDLVMTGQRSAADYGVWVNRLRGSAPLLRPAATFAEYAPGDAVLSFEMDGVKTGTDGTAGGINFSGRNYVNWFFKRAPGVFDMVCYTSDGTYNPIAHGLGVVPELVIQKMRNGTGDWYVFDGVKYGLLNTTAAWSAFARTLTSTTFVPITQSGGNTFVVYLFATKPGISKVGSYTGNGSSQTINAGFTTGARFVLIKRTDSTGDWYVWDSVRGIVAGNDPHLSLNTSAAEVTTDDSVDTDTSGFIVNQLAATNINVTSASYVFLAFS